MDSAANTSTKESNMAIHIGQEIQCSGGGSVRVIKMEKIGNSVVVTYIFSWNGEDGEGREELSALLRWIG